MDEYSMIIQLSRMVG